MNVLLTPESEQLVHAKIQSGRFHNATEVIDEALRLMAETDGSRARQLREVQQKIQAGFDQSERGDEVDGESFMQQMLDEMDAAHARQER